MKRKFYSFARILKPYSEIKRLSILHSLSNGEWSRAAKRRIRFHKRLAECAEDGKVALVFSGMDCDCTSYENEVHFVSSNWREVEAYLDHHYSWVDGPCSYYIERPSIADELLERSRDLALEAFENGHPHYIVRS